MTKKELLNELQISGLINKKEKESPIWKEAFEQYKAVSGDYQVSMDCGVCFSKVLKWLQQ